MQNQIDVNVIICPSNPQGEILVFLVYSAFLVTNQAVILRSAMKYYSLLSQTRSKLLEAVMEHFYQLDSFIELLRAFSVNEHYLML